MLLRELTLSDEDTFHRANNEAWEEHFVFAHYFESLAQIPSERKSIFPKF